jgi:DNA-binding IclR family transcriptional regulator
MPDTSAPRPQVPAADQTLRILSLLARQRGPVAARTIATQLGVPRSSVYHLLATLEEHGFVVHLPAERRWGLGTAAFELAGGYARQQPLARLGRPLIAALADRTGESAHLAVMTGRDVLYIVEERAPRRPALVTDVGVRLPAHLTATGRAMLAALPREQVRALYPDAASFADRTGRGPALLDHAGWPIAAVAVTYPDDAPKDAADLARLIDPAAAELGRRIGGVGAR